MSINRLKILKIFKKIKLCIEIDSTKSLLKYLNAYRPRVIRF